MADSIKIGSLDISAFKVGSDDVTAIYLGNTLVYSGGTPPTPTYEWVVYSEGDTVPSSTIYGVKLYVDYENSWEIDFGVDSGISFSYENYDWTALDIETYEQIDISSYFDDGEGCYIILFSDLGYDGLTICIPEPEVETFECDIDLYEESQPTPPAHDYSQDYLTFVAEEDGTFKFSGNSIFYSLDDGETWTILYSNTNSPTVNAGSKIMWKATGIAPSSSIGIGRFSSTANFTVEGNANSLLWGDDFNGHTSLSNKSYAFKSLFENCVYLTSAENLILQATTLALRCYYSMFYNCTSLTTAPELPATTTYNQCYSYMFENCSSLNNITCLAVDISANSCTYNWVRSVASNGTFTKAQGVSWSRGTSGIPYNWTIQDYSS